MANELDKIKIDNVTVTKIVEDDTTAAFPTKTSQLTNDSGYLMTTSKATSATNADSAPTITASSGVTAGTYGPGSNVTIGNTSSGSIQIPQFTVNAKGLVTGVNVRTLSVTNKCSNCSNCGHTYGCNQSSGCAHSTCQYNCSNSCNNCNHCSNSSSSP